MCKMGSKVAFVFSAWEFEMLTLDEIKRLLADRRLDIVSSSTLISRNTLSAIRDGKNTNPTLRTIEALSIYLSPRDE
jgi:DNA-binding Xre family transcriptional regulator